MKRDKDWTDVLRSELRHAEPTPPADGWERLRHALAQADAAAENAAARGAAAEIPAVNPDAATGKDTAPAGGASGNAPAEQTARGTVAPLWPRIAAAAAAVILFVAAGELLWRANGGSEQGGSVVLSDGSGTADETLPAALRTIPESAPERVSANRTEQLPEIAVAQTVAPPTAATATATAAATAATATALPAAPSSPAVPAASAPQGGIGSVLGAAPDDKPATSAENAPGRADPSSAAEPRSAAQPRETGQLRETGQPRETAQTRKTADPARHTAISDERFVAYARARKKTSFGLFAGGVVTGGGSAGPAAGGRWPMQSDFSSMIGNGDNLTLMQRADYGDASFRHHQPVSFGLSVRREFAHGLSLESGVIYTLLRSDVRMHYASKDIGQRLHFIGVPLRANWQWLRRAGFSLYIGAGGMVEKCVYAKFGSKIVHENGVDWSLLGVAGAEYRFGGLVGLYFEPEASYYFTRTSLETARTESPLTLTLRLGVRFTF